MATQSASYGQIDGTPVKMFRQFTGDGGIELQLNVRVEELREEIFESYGVTSVEELSTKVSGGGKGADIIRVGVVVGEGDTMRFLSETELLQRVSGIGEELAEGLLTQFNDLPTICERQRTSGEVFLGETLHDVRLEEREWSEELEEFIDELEAGGGFEMRMKDAGVWVEPQTAESAL